MAESHGTPLMDSAAFEALPDEVKEEIQADFVRLKANLPEGELPDDKPAGIGATSAGLLIVKTETAAYQLMEDGSTMRARPGPDGMELLQFKDGEVLGVSSSDSA